MLTLVNDKVERVLDEIEPIYDTVFMDPPDNIGLGYNEYCDTLSGDKYIWWLRGVIQSALYKAKNAVWVSYNSIHTFSMGAAVGDLLREVFTDWQAIPCVQTYTFYQHNKHDLGKAHRPMVRFTRKGGTLYPNAIRVPSWRQLNGDPRANPNGKVPGDVFDFPRVTGNSKQRRKWHPTQLKEGLVERCLKLTTPEGGNVLDLFSGTGTTMRVCKRLGFNCLSVELDTFYCERIAEDNGLKRKSKVLWDA